MNVFENVTNIQSLFISISDFKANDAYFDNRMYLNAQQVSANGGSLHHPYPAPESATPPRTMANACDVPHLSPAFRPQHTNFSAGLSYSRYSDGAMDGPAADAPGTSLLYDTVAGPDTTEGGVLLDPSSQQYAAVYSGGEERRGHEAADEHCSEHVRDCPLHPDNQCGAHSTAHARHHPADDTGKDTDGETEPDMDRYVDEYKRLHVTGDYVDENYDVGAPAVYIKPKAHAGTCRMTDVLGLSLSMSFSLCCKH